MFILAAFFGRFARAGDRAFCAKIAVANMLGYLVATIPPIIIDPKLIHHVRYGARHYPIGWWVLPISIVVGIATYAVMALVREQKRTIWNSIPLLLATGCSLPFFRPEFPHMTVLTATVFTFLLSIAATWIRYAPLKTERAHDPGLARDMRVKWVEGQSLFWRGATVAILAIFLTAINSWFRSMLDADRAFDTIPGELVLLTHLVIVLTSFGTSWFILGPLIEAVRKCKQANDLLLAIK